MSDQEKTWTPAERFGANLVWFRREAGLSQQELGDRIGLNRSRLSDLEKGRRLPRLDTILKLVAALDVSACHLLAWIWWDPASHQHYETPAAIADISGFEVRDFRPPGRFPGVERRLRDHRGVQSAAQKAAGGGPRRP
jgi:transcriptional regulator with XRE-family HTH domain